MLAANKVLHDPRILSSLRLLVAFALGLVGCARGDFRGQIFEGQRRASVVCPRLEPDVLRLRLGIGGVEVADFGDQSKKARQLLAVRERARSAGERCYAEALDMVATALEHKWAARGEVPGASGGRLFATYLDELEPLWIPKPPVEPKHSWLFYYSEEDEGGESYWIRVPHSRSIALQALILGPRIDLVELANF